MPTTCSYISYLGLVEIMTIEYNQYSVPFSSMGPIFMRGQSLRPLRTELSKIFHTSVSSIGLFLLFQFHYDSEKSSDS